MGRSPFDRLQPSRQELRLLEDRVADLERTTGLLLKEISRTWAAMVVLVVLAVVARLLSQ